MDDVRDPSVADSPDNGPVVKWQFDEAQRRLDEIADLAQDEGPQVITRHGKDFILMTRLEYWRLTGEKPTFLEFLMNGPSFDGLDLDRDRSPMRDVDL